MHFNKIYFFFFINFENNKLFALFHPMLFVNTPRFNKYFFPLLESIHKHESKIVIFTKSNELFVYNNNILEQEVRNVVSASYKNQIICYVTDKTYLVDLVKNEIQTYEHKFTKIFLMKDQILGYKKSTLYLIDVKKNTLKTRQFICKKIKVNNKYIFCKLNDDLYILNKAMECLESIKIYTDVYDVNDKYIVVYSDNNLVFLDFHGEFVFEYDTKCENVKYVILMQDFIVFQSENLISIGKMDSFSVKLFKEINITEKNKKTKIENNEYNNNIENLIKKTEDCVITLKYKSKFCAIDNKYLFVYNDNFVKGYDFIEFEPEDFLRNFAIFYVLKNIIFGILNNKIYIYDSKGIFLDKFVVDGQIMNIEVNDKAIIKIRNDLEIGSKIYIIIDSIPLHVKILHHDEILNTEEEYYIYKDDNSYNLSYYGKEVKSIENKGNNRKIIFHDNNFFCLDDSNRLLEYNDILDFYFFNENLVLVLENNIKIFQGENLICDIILDYILYFIHKNSIFLLTIDQIIVINETVMHYDIKCQDMYKSGDFICLRILNKFIFLNDLDDYKEEENIKSELKQRSIALKNLSDDTERIAKKSKSLEHLAKDIEEKRKKRFWFF